MEAYVYQVSLTLHEVCMHDALPRLILLIPLSPSACNANTCADAQTYSASRRNTYTVIRLKLCSPPTNILHVVKADLFLRYILNTIRQRIHCIFACGLVLEVFTIPCVSVRCKSWKRSEEPTSDAVISSL